MESAAIHSSEIHEVVFRIPPSPFSQKEFFLPLRLSCKESSTFLTKPLFPQEREDVAGSAIAPPEFWSASGACARKGLAGSAYAIELRLFVGWRINTVAYPPLDVSYGGFGVCVNMIPIDKYCCIR